MVAALTLAVFVFCDYRPIPQLPRGLLNVCVAADSL
jgi:hypothetical protein